MKRVTKIINTKYLASAKLEFKIFFFLKIIVFIYLALLGLCCCTGFSLSAVRGDYSSVVCGLLTAVVSCVEERRLQTHGLRALQL